MTTATKPVPPLRNGDHLDRIEFARRYEAMPEVKKAELIEGIVFMPFRVPLVGHGEEHARLGGALGMYAIHTPSIQGASGTTVRLDSSNEFQPDTLLLLDPRRGGQAKIVGGFVHDGPELIGEVCYSRVSIELHAKKDVYLRNRVREYLVWRTEEGEIDWFALHGGVYEPLPIDSYGVVRSEVFPGLWLDVRALLMDDGLRVLAVLEQGIASPEHAAFVAKLQPPATA